MAKTSIHVALEIGTSKTCMVVGEISPDASATIIGIGEVKSVGIRRGEICDLTYASRCVRDAWAMAQDHADVEIRSIFLSITGDHFIGDNQIGSYRLPDNERIVTQKHMDIVRDKAENFEVSKDRFIVDTVTGNYSIDGREPSAYPARLTARTLDVSSHIIHGIESRVHNSVICVRQVPLEIENLVFAPVATAQCVLSREQRAAGALLIDIGAGTTDFACYLEGNLVASGCIPVGGSNINQDIHRLTDQRVSLEAAEVLKCTEGNAFGDFEDSSLASYHDSLGLHSVQIRRGELNQFICERLTDTLMRVKKKLPPEALEKGSFSVYLAGGTSMMRGLDLLAHRVFRCKVYQPSIADNKEGEYAFLTDPRYCTAIGLIRMAQLHAQRAENSKTGIFSRMFQYFTGH